MLLLSLSGCGKEDREPPPPVVTSTSQSLDGGPAEPAPIQLRQYSDSKKGLAQLIEDLLEAIEGNDEPRQAALLHSLRLPEPESWFEETFGDDLGATLARNYQKVADNIGLLQPVLKRQLERKSARVVVEKYAGPKSQDATGYQNALLAKMRNKLPLYSVRLSSTTGQKTTHLWSFVYVDDGFRYLGKLKDVSNVPRPKGRDLFEFRVSDTAKIQTAGDSE